MKVRDIQCVFSIATPLNCQRIHLPSIFSGYLDFLKALCSHGARKCVWGSIHGIKLCLQYQNVRRWVYIIQTTAAVRIFASTRRQQLVLECLLLDFHNIVDEIQGTRVLKLLHTYEWTSNVQQRAPNLVIYNKGSKENFGATKMLVSGVQEKVIGEVIFLE